MGCTSVFTDHPSQVPPPLARSSMRQPPEIDMWLLYMIAPMSGSYLLSGPGHYLFRLAWCRRLARSYFNREPREVRVIHSAERYSALGRLLALRFGDHR